MDQTISILAVLRTRDRITALQSALDGTTAANITVQVGELRNVIPRLSKGNTPSVLIVDLALDNQSEIDLLSRIIQEHGAGMAVIATAENAELAGIRQLMRIGVTDFIPQPLSRADVIGALESASAKLAPNRRSAATTGRVITFIRSCGGVGATTLAVQSAIELAGRGRNKSSVALLDLDLQFGNASLSLDVQDKGGLPLILEAPARLDPAFLRASMNTHETGISILSAPDSIVPLNALAPETISRLLALARNEFDFVVCDMPHVWTNWTASVLGESDRIVLVTGLTVTALQRTRRQLDVMADQGLEDIPLSIVANRYDGGWGQKGRKKQAESALGRSVDYVVRDDPKTAVEAQDRGVPLSAVRSRSKIVKDLRVFMDELRNSFRDGDESPSPEKA
jgi:pilus assembly protein CpaE